MPAISEKQSDGAEIVIIEWPLFVANTNAPIEQRMLDAAEYIAGAIGILAKAKLDEPHNAPYPDRQRLQGPSES